MLPILSTKILIYIFRDFDNPVAPINLMAIKYSTYKFNGSYSKYSYKSQNCFSCYTNWYITRHYIGCIPFLGGYVEFSYKTVSENSLTLIQTVCRTFKQMFGTSIGNSKLYGFDLFVSGIKWYKRQCKKAPII